VANKRKTPLSTPPNAVEKLKQLIIRLSGNSAIQARLGRDLASLREEDPGGGAGVVDDAVEVA